MLAICTCSTSPPPAGAAAAAPAPVAGATGVPPAGPVARSLLPRSHRVPQRGHLLAFFPCAPVLVEVRVLHPLAASHVLAAVTNGRAAKGGTGSASAAPVGAQMHGRAGAGAFRWCGTQSPAARDVRRGRACHVQRCQQPVKISYSRQSGLKRTFLETARRGRL